jgi:hypothetical protein
MGSHSLDAPNNFPAIGVGQYASLPASLDVQEVLHKLDGGEPFYLNGEAWLAVLGPDIRRGQGRGLGPGGDREAAVVHHGQEELERAYVWAVICFHGLAPWFYGMGFGYLQNASGWSKNGNPGQ